MFSRNFAPFLGLAISLAGCSPAPPPAITPVPQVRVRYPPDMYAQKIEGDAEVICTITAEGKTTNCAVTKATNAEFAEYALIYVQSAIYKPAMRNGAPVEERQHTFNIKFRMN